MASSFAVARLTGEYVLDHHSASQCDPLYDLADERWAEDWAAEIAPGVPLPRLVWPVEVAGEVTAAAAAETGIPAGTPVMAGTVDAWAEAFSVGVRQPGDLMLMYGSTLFFVQVTEEPTTDPLLWATAGVEPHSRSLAAGSAHNLGAFAAAVGPPRRVVAVGGGTQASLWAQIVSDVSSISQAIPAQAIGAAYGDALMAAIGAGLVAPETDWTRTTAVVEPDPAVAARYDALYDDYLRLYPATAALSHRLAALQREG
jgi:sugar (pentulose or hexulose) kinase